MEALTFARLLTTRPATFASAEILSLPGKPRETAGPADEIWDLGATETLEVLNIDRVSVFRLARFVRGQIGIVLVGKVRPGWLRV